MDDNGHDGSADSGRTGAGGPHPGFLHPHPKGWTGPHPHTPVENPSPDVLSALLVLARVLGDASGAVGDVELRLPTSMYRVVEVAVVLREAELAARLGLPVPRGAMCVAIRMPWGCLYISEDKSL